jgi:hypothetical protein
MTKSDSPKYEAPCGVRLGEAAKGLGMPSCESGSSDVSCGPGSGATAHCDNGQGAAGCQPGSNPGISTCRPGSEPRGGCVDGHGVHPLQ